MIWNTSLDGPIILVAVLAAVSCALPGCFLVLRRMSLMGDAISHAILPGLVVAFLISQNRAGLPMFLGAVVVGLLTAVLTESLRRVGRVDESASMGVVFTSLFAVGVVLISVFARQVDLDPNCVLNGNLEALPFSPDKLRQVVFSLSAILLVNALLVVVLFKEFRITSFDPQLSSTLGINSTLMHFLLMTMTALTTVAAFEAVGAILVVAMLIVPAATAQLMTDRLSVMVTLAAVMAAIFAVGGHLFAVTLPAATGIPGVDVAGMIAVVGGAGLVSAAVFAPRLGLLSRLRHHRRLARQIIVDDLLLSLCRFDESSPGSKVGVDQLTAFVPAHALRRSVDDLTRRGMILRSGDQISLSDVGRREAIRLLRTHRLWESYLADVANIPADHTHAGAHRLEHLRGVDAELADAVGHRDTDPQSRPIPPAPN
jgi:manganese/zinc/iron transport system permease protein